MEILIMLILSWIRNIFVTIVEAIQIAYTIVELIINSIARLVPGNVVILFIHDKLAKVHITFKNIKIWLLKLNV